ncbi:MAG: glycosyltransferase [Lachnospiraceae bacterium]|nr:glycosyltransferase [Lachnospiraceae bacterium]
MMEIKVSVILPSLNVKDYIEEAVNSVMGQTLKEIEILCIDAGSEDGTWEILSQLAEVDERIILCHSDVKSYGYQVNMGISMARGEYIAILETDDYADSGMYERLYQEAVSADCDYVKSDYFLCRTEADGKRTFFRRYSFQTDNLYGKVIEPAIYPAVAVGDWYLWTGIYKRKFLTDYHIRLSETPGAAYQDIGFIFQTNITAKKALYVKEAYYRYRVDREGASANSGRGLEYAYQEFFQLYERMKDKGDHAAFCVFYSRMAKSFIYCCEGMEEGHTEIDDIKWSAYYEWFQYRLKAALAQGMVDKTLFRPDVWIKLEDLLISEAYYLEKYRAHKRKIADIIGPPGEYAVIIFGSGHYGCEACKWLKKQEYGVAYFIDNNRELWGTKINGIEVVSPQEIKTKDGIKKYLIANEMHSGAMKQQLQRMGVSEKDICIYV